MNVKLFLAIEWENHFNLPICKLQHICGAAVYGSTIHVEV